MDAVLAHLFLNEEAGRRDRPPGVREAAGTRGAKKSARTRGGGGERPR